MNRRELMKGGAALAGMALAAATVAAEHRHDHAGMQHDRLFAALGDCIQLGQACLSHCHDLLGEGEKSMAGCAKSVSEMLALCGALQQLANQRSRHTGRLATLAMEACRQCEDECSKHAEKHEICKACGESCATCARACEKIAA